MKKRFIVVVIAILMANTGFALEYPWEKDGGKESKKSAPGDSAGQGSTPSPIRFFIGGDWICNYGKVRRDTPGNKRIKIEQSGDQLTFVNDSGQRSKGRFIDRDLLVASNWEYGEEARLGINVDGKFFSVTDASKQFNVREGTDWNFIRWESGAVCFMVK